MSSVPFLIWKITSSVLLYWGWTFMKILISNFGTMSLATKWSLPSLSSGKVAMMLPAKLRIWPPVTIPEFNISSYCVSASFVCVRELVWEFGKKRKKKQLTKEKRRNWSFNQCLNRLTWLARSTLVKCVSFRWEFIGLAGNDDFIILMCGWEKNPESRFVSII